MLHDLCARLQHRNSLSSEKLLGVVFSQSDCGRARLVNPLGHADSILKQVLGAISTHLYCTLCGSLPPACSYYDMIVDLDVVFPFLPVVTCCTCT